MTKYILISASNEFGIWQADISESNDGFLPTRDPAHLILGDLAEMNGCAAQVGPMLTAIGWAIEDEIAMGVDEDENGPYDHAVRAKAILENAADAEFIVRVETGGIFKDDAMKRLGLKSTAESVAVAA